MTISLRSAFKDYKYIVVGMLAACLLLSLCIMYVMPSMADLRIAFEGDLTILGSGLQRTSESFMSASQRNLDGTISGLYSYRINYLSATYICQNNQCLFNNGVIGYLLTPKFTLPWYSTRMTQIEYGIDYAQDQISAHTMWNSNELSDSSIPDVSSYQIGNLVNYILNDESEGFLAHNSDFRLSISWGRAYNWNWQIQLYNNTEYIERIVDF